MIVVKGKRKPSLFTGRIKDIDGDAEFGKESFSKDEIAKMFGLGDRRMDFGQDVAKYREFVSGAGDQTVPDLADDPLTRRRMAAVGSRILRGADTAASDYARSTGGGSGSAASAARKAALRSIAGGAASRAADDVMQGEREFRADIERANLDRRQRGLSDILGFGTSWRGQNIALMNLLDDRTTARWSWMDAERNRRLQKEIADDARSSAMLQSMIRAQAELQAQREANQAEEKRRDQENRATRQTPTDSSGSSGDYGSPGGTGYRVTDANDISPVMFQTANAPETNKKTQAKPKWRMAWRRPL